MSSDHQSALVCIICKEFVLVLLVRCHQITFETFFISFHFRTSLKQTVLSVLQLFYNKAALDREVSKRRIEIECADSGMFLFCELCLQQQRSRCIAAKEKETTSSHTDITNWENLRNDSAENVTWLTNDGKSKLDLPVQMHKMSLFSFLFLLIFPVIKNHMGDIAQEEALLPFSLGGGKKDFEPGHKVGGWDGDGGSLK